MKFNKQKYILIFLLLLLTSCGRGSVVEPKDIGYEISPVFREFYQSLGGEALFGNAINESYEKDGKVYQYVVAGLFVSDPFMHEGKRVYFASLGSELGYYEPPKTKFDTLDGTYFNGYEIHDSFVPLFTKMGGIEVVGYPISNANYNPEKKQIEQYFENLGFYLADDMDLAYVGLLPYGRISCGTACSLSVFVNQAEQEESSDNFVPEPFSSFVNQLGHDFVGISLTDVYDAGDGTVHIVFENMVLYTLVGDESQVYALPISELLGFPRTTPSLVRQSDAAYFYRIEGDYGYSVPNGVNDYLLDHGGYEFSGAPISEVDKVAELQYRQCFENLCVDIDVDPVTKEERVHPLNLGLDYKEKFYQEPEVIELIDEYSLNVWVADPLISSDKPQTIFVQISNEAKDSLKGIKLVIILTYPPDLRQERLEISKTDREGLTHINIKPVDAQNGSRVKYEVCMEDGSVCAEGKYTLWSD